MKQIQWMFKIQASKIGITLKSELFNVPFPDIFEGPKSERFRLDFRRNTSLDHFKYIRSKLYIKRSSFLSQDLRPKLVRFSDILL